VRPFFVGMGEGVATTAQRGKSVTGMRSQGNKEHGVPDVGAVICNVGVGVGCELIAGAVSSSDDDPPKRS
jgi:hypothetical protein